MFVSAKVAKKKDISFYNSINFIIFAKKKMKRWVLFMLFALIVLLLLVYCAYYIRPYYAPAVKQEGLNVIKHDDDTIRIAYIGDSWADGHKKVRCVMDSIISRETKRHVEVKTAGISGLTSKNIYYGIYRDDSMKSAIEWGPDFCFVVAGINDSDRKMGKHYYQENMQLIIELLLNNQIIPIILEIPSYDIHFSFQRRNRGIKLQYLVSMLLTLSAMDCIQDYRNAYKDMIRKQNWEDSVITISVDDWNPIGYKDKRGLYDGGHMHLNERGYLVLDSCIAQKIVNYLNTQSYSVCR